ncbi:hypothetical protein B0T10DRAFT_540294 [Thelonectria olida]|uniref:Zn(2)-C6 fungal-type domain-containing protein n=1 Tax=Thelonectria olida TaxID=1576542 RepID=A0A9P8VWF5_9HYPO|nr:hypothetical protein B0T10DRAFT_540294 [Thelonectria olida]
MSADEASSSRRLPPPGPPASRPAYPRKRAAQACRTCRRRRVKCDNERPSCTACMMLEVQCMYQEGDKSSFDAASLAILNRLDDLESLVRAVNPEALARLQGEAAAPQTPGNVVPLAEPVSSDVYRINIEAVLEWPILRCSFPAPPPPLASILQASRSNPSLSRPRLLSTSDLDPDSTAPLLQSFVDNFHIYNPVFEIPEIEECVKTTLYNGLGWDVTSCISLLVFALGTIAIGDDNASSTSAFRRSTRFQDAESFFVAAQRRMGQLLCNSGLEEAHAFFLAGVYLMSTMRPFEAWRMFVQALACCQIFESSSFDDEHNSELQLHKRIYWTAFKSELELRLELGITENSTWSLRYPQFFPAPPKGLQSAGEEGWYFYLAEIALRRLGNRILTHTSHFKSPETTVADKLSRILELEQQAQDWIYSLPPALKLDRPIGQAADSQGERLRFILNGHLIDCYEMMYWPFVVDMVHRRLPEDTDCVMFARKGFQMCVKRIEENEAGFHLRHHGTWLMLRSCTRSALVLAAASRAGLDAMLPPNWKSSIAKVIHLLQYWKDEALDVASRLEWLEALV